ncbi:MAG TPA: tetratricopeptide repeat protein, partial [Lysobacter sp.]|nr:tetratricopeptide repeat protein [Lysobacter sp.]
TTSLELALAHAARLLDSNPALAAEQAGEILRVVGDHPRALHVLAMARVRQGDDQSAVGILGPLARACPRWAQAQADLGAALARLGRFDEAIVALRQATTLQPDSNDAWLALADALHAGGDAAGADAAYLRHVQQSAKDPRLLAIGKALFENRLPEAEEQLRARLERAPNDVAALRMLAEVDARLGRDDDALQLLTRCLERAPGFHAARKNLAQVLNRGNRQSEALEQVDALLAADPANPGYRNLKAVILGRIGDYAGAIELYEELLAAHPRHPQLWMSHGHALKTAGFQDRAIAAYRRAIEIDPACGEAYWSLANLKTVRFDAGDIAAMQRQLQRTDLADEPRLHFDFALGKALEDGGEYERSFRHYLDGNARRLKLVPYSADDNAGRGGAARRVYTREFFAEREGWGCDAPDPIFIVGMPRAGSTLVEQILSSHPAVEGTMELPEIISLARSLRRRADSPQTTSYHDILAGIDAEEARALGEQYLERTRIHRKRGAPLFIDKMPNNFAHIGLVRLALPNAKIIDARRHPLACCLSGFKQHFARGQDFSYSLDDIGRYYRDYVELMAHFDDALPGCVHRVIYEDMVADTESEVRRLLDYCGLLFEEACLRFFENPRAVRTASSEQVRQPIYRDGIDHWRHYEAWLGPLRAALGPVLDAYPRAPSFSS